MGRQSDQGAVMSTSPQPSETLPALSRTERRVLALVVEGRTNHFIRVRLGTNAKALTLTLRRLYQLSGIHLPGQPYTPAELRRGLIRWGRNYFQRLEESERYAPTT
jgi:DNA-binding NarL/FixJ family response regulator